MNKTEAYGEVKSNSLKHLKQTKKLKIKQLTDLKGKKFNQIKRQKIIYPFIHENNANGNEEIERKSNNRMT